MVYSLVTHDHRVHLSRAEEPEVPSLLAQRNLWLPEHEGGDAVESGTDNRVAIEEASVLIPHPLLRAIMALILVMVTMRPTHQAPYF